MTTRSPLYQQIDTLPDLVRAVAQPFDESARRSFSFETCTSAKRVYLVGCGDSYHASYGAELAFHQLAGVPAQALSSLSFSRYTVGYLPPTGPLTNLVIAVSVSGVVSRTIEAAALARKAGATTIALTGTAGSPLAQTAEQTFLTTVPPLPDEMRGMVVPGVRSYLASQVALYSAAIRIGEVRGHLTTMQADQWRAELRGLADVLAATIAACEPLVKDWAARWQKPTAFDFVGGGPLYGAAMFSAAKLLEATGEPALAQETEEWTHLQYFVDQPTPTVLLDAAGLDASRMAELARAAQSIQRPVVAVLPEGEQDISQYVDAVWPIKGQVRECFAPLVASIPGELLAAERAALLGTAYFRNFEGGRTVPWSKEGASRIRDSHMIDEVGR
jgi:glucosamine--fructose-6-phosphate aminotransferase (isomerizing)